MTVHLGLFTVLCVVIGADVSLAQTASEGSLRGYVRDQQGGVLPGVTITATSETVARSRVTTTDIAGLYRLIDLRPGEYTITAELPGFATFTRSGVVIRAGLNLSLDLAMTVGALSESVEVRGGNPMLESERPTQAVNFSGEMERRLPLSGRRDWGDVMQLTPGVASLTNNASGGQYYMRGSEVENHVVQLDGADVGAFHQGWAAQYFNVGTDAIEDVQIKTAGVDAASPLAVGMVVNIATPTGTDQFRGSLSSVWTHDSWNSNNSRGGSSAAMAIVQPDATIGGPIKRRRAWFFGTVRYTRRNTGISRTEGTLALLQSLQPEFKPFDNLSRQKFYFAKTTVQLSPNHQLYAFAQHDGDADDQNTDLFGSRINVFSFGGDAYASRLSSSYGSSVTSRILVAYNNKGLNRNASVWDAVPSDRPSVQVHRDAFPSSGALVGTGVLATLDSLPSHFVTAGTKRTISADVTYYRKGGIGSHELQAGTYLQNFTGSRRFLYPNGGFSLEEAVLRDPNNPSVGFIPFHRTIFGSSDHTVASIWAHDYGVYLQDSWKPVVPLTIIAGVRLDWIKSQDRLFGLVIQDHREIGPRIGGTYVLTDDKTNIVRASWGRVHDIPMFLYLGAAVNIGTNQPGQRDLYDLDRNGSFETEYVTPPSSVASAQGLIDPNRRQGHVDEWLVGYRRQLPGQVSLDASFIRRAYKHRPALVEVNGVYDGVVFSGYKNEAFNDLFQITSNRWNWFVYSGIEFTATKRTRSLQLVSGYTRTFQHIEGTWQPNDPASFIEPTKFLNDGGLGIIRGNSTNSYTGDTRNVMWKKHLGSAGIVYTAPWKVVLASNISVETGAYSGPVVTRIAAPDARFGTSTVRLSNGRVVTNPLSTTLRFAGTDRGDQQLQAPTRTVWSIRVGRDFTVAGYRLQTAVDVFNVTNRGALQEFKPGGNQLFSPNYGVSADGSFNGLNRQAPRVGQLTIRLLF